MAERPRFRQTGAQAAIDPFGAALVFIIHRIEQRLDRCQMLRSIRVGAPVGTHPTTIEHVDMAGAVRAQTQIPEIARRQGNQQRGVDRQKPGDAALIALQGGIGRVGQRQRHGVVFHYEMVIERGRPLGAGHFQQIDRAADGAGMTDRQVVAFHEILGQHLPVGGPAKGFAKGFAVAGHIQIADQRIDIFQLRRQVGGGGVQRHHDPALPDLCP